MTPGAGSLGRLVRLPFTVAGRAGATAVAPLVAGARAARGLLGSDEAPHAGSSTGAPPSTPQRADPLAPPDPLTPPAPIVPPSPEPIPPPRPEGGIRTLPDSELLDERDSDLTSLEPEPPLPPVAAPAPPGPEERLVGEFADPGAQDGAGPEIHVAEPWEGYDRETAEQILDALDRAEPAVLAAVELYEASHRHRVAVLDGARERLRAAE